MTRLIVACLVLFSGVAGASGIVIRDAYIPLLPPFSNTYAAYLVISNTQARERTVVAVSAEGFGMAHLHRSMLKDGVVSMSALPTLEIPAADTIRMEPGGIHVMLMNRLVELAENRSVVIDLTFNDGEVISVKATLREID